MSTRTREQSIRLHTILGKLQVDAEGKQDLVFAITKGREKSTTGLTHLECNALINDLQAKLPKNESKSDKMRKKILSTCHEMRWTINGKIDFDRLNEYLLKYGYKHKELNEYTEKELPVLVTQFDNLLISFYEKR